MILPVHNCPHAGKRGQTVCKLVFTSPNSISIIKFSREEVRSGLNLPLSLRTCATLCDRCLLGSQRLRNKASGRVCRKSWSTDPPLLSSSEGERETEAVTGLFGQRRRSSLSFEAYSTEISRSRSGVQTQEKPHNCDHVVLHKRLLRHTWSSDTKPIPSSTLLKTK